MECSEQDLTTLAKLDVAKIKFVQATRAFIREQSRLPAPSLPVHGISYRALVEYD